MPKIQEQKGRMSITIPAEIARMKGWKKGDGLGFRVSGKEICYFKNNNQAL